MSWRTRRVALAVNAAIGRSGNACRSALNCRYSGRNSWPHSEMQCASSMAKKAMGTRRSQAMVSSRASRSGERYSSRNAPCAGFPHHLLLLAERLRAVDHRGGNAHLRELRRLVLHQRDQRRDDDHGLAQHQRRQLVAERFPAAGGHHHRDVVAVEQAMDDALLQRAEGIVAPVPPQCALQIQRRAYLSIIGPQRAHVDVAEGDRAVIALQHDRILRALRGSPSPRAWDRPPPHCSARRGR